MDPDEDYFSSQFTHKITESETGGKPIIEYFDKDGNDATPR